MKLIFNITVAILLSVKAFASEEPSTGCPTISVTGTPVNCYGGSNGTAQLNILSGSGSYTITWSNGVTASTSLSLLSAGTYTVNLKDNVSGCTVFGAYVVNQPTAMVTSHTVTNVNCFNGSNGTIDLTVTGGSAPYSYDWVPFGGPSDPQDISGLAAGSYTVTVKDSKNCTASRTAFITQPNQALTSSATSVNASCNGQNSGSIDLIVSGGTFPYSYSWNNASVSEDLNAIGAGTYAVNITDNKGCLATRNVTITEPSALVSSLLATNVSCFGTNTGSLASTTVGGTAPYTYTWQSATNLYSINTPNLLNIPAGNFQINVTDSKGCTTNAIAVVTEPTELVISASKVDVNCHGDATGSIDLTALGGTVPYSYSWVNQLMASYGTTQDLNLIPKGTYTVVVNDSYGCSRTLSRVITEPEFPLSSTYTLTNVNCFGNATGIINTTPDGGTTPYIYTWSNGASSEDIDLLAAGNYAYAILDAKGCGFGDNVTITQPAAPLTFTSSSTPVICYGESNGSVDVITSGGTSPYTYVWQNQTYLMSNVTSSLTDVTAQTYSFVITDAKGCTNSGSQVVNQPTQLEISITGVNILCFGGNNGSTDITVTGGVLPYTYLWNNGATSEDLDNLIAGTYSVIVTDFNNCTISASITLSQPETPLSFEYEFENAKCNNSEDGWIDLTVQGGTPSYLYDWSNGDLDSYAQQIGAGTYTFLVTDANGCTIGGQHTLTEPAPLSMNEIITDVTCFGLSNGSIDVNPTGGTVPYSYKWYDSQYALSTQTQDLIAAVSDTFQLEIIDSNNCFYEMFWFIPQPNKLVASFTSDDVNCADGSDGSILVDVFGGNGGNTFLWSNGATTEDVFDIPLGTYNFMVTDTKNCKDSLSVQIFEPAPVLGEFDITPVSCKDQYDGSIKTQAFGGTGNFTFAWSNGENTPDIANLPRSNYSIVITDVLGCTFDTTVFVDRLNEFCIYPPNAFTPNGDAYNDTWFIENLDVYTNIDLTVFNKWGNIVHEQKGLYKPWDGLIKGVIAPAETYYYILYLNNTDEDKLKGSVTLLR